MLQYIKKELISCKKILAIKQKNRDKLVYK